MKKQNPFKGIVFTALILFFVLFSTAASASQATNTIRTTIDQVIELLKSGKFQDDSEAKKAELRKIINPRFSYKQMSMRSLAKHWNGKSDSEKKRICKPI